MIGMLLPREISTRHGIYTRKVEEIFWADSATDRTICGYQRGRVGHVLLRASGPAPLKHLSEITTLADTSKDVKSIT